MTTHQFFIKQSQIGPNRTVAIRGADARHISHVLRLKKGERIKLVDEAQQLYIGSIEKLSPEAVLVSIAETPECAPEQARVCLIQGVPRLPKLDLIVQKVTELGIGKILLAPTERSPYPDAFQRVQKRLERLQAIAEAAVKQCGRRCIPQVIAAESLENTFHLAGDQAFHLIASEKYSGKALHEILAVAPASSPITVFVGPEGGFSDSEIDFLKSKNGAEFSLGKNILRTETAAIVATAIVLYELGEL
jgi:16S rRNA (uracil1498-N3)-methyltransferase